MADTGNKKVAITNNDQGPRYVFTARGMEVIPKGGVLETEASEAQLTAIEDAEIANAEGVAMFSVAGITRIEGESEPQPLDKLSLTALRKLAAAEEVPLKDRKDGEGNSLPDLKTASDIAEAIQAKRDASSGAPQV